MVTFVLPECAAASTRTASVAGVSKSKPVPVASVRVADVLPDAPPVTLEMDRPESAGPVTSAKLDADTAEA